MLFSYETPTKTNPYFTSIDQLPQYQQEQKVEHREKMLGGAFGALFQAAASFIPGIGGAIGKIGAEGINQSLQNRHDESNAFFQNQLSHQMPKVTTTGGLTGLGETFSRDNISPLQKLAESIQKKNADSAQNGMTNSGDLSKMALNNLNSKVGSDNTMQTASSDTSMPVDLTQGGGSSNFDFSSFDSLQSFCLS